MRRRLLKRRDSFTQRLPHIGVVTDVYEQRGLVAFDVGQQVLDDAAEQVELRASSADGEQVADRPCALSALAAARAVEWNVQHEFVVDEMAGVVQRTFGHGFQLAFLVHAAERFVAEVCRWRLHGMSGPFCEVQRHGPVIRNRVDHVRQAGMDCSLCRPCMCSDERHVAWQVGIRCDHEFGSLLVGGVVCELAESLRVHRLPNKLVEQPDFLREARAKRVQVVLL